MIEYRKMEAVLAKIAAARMVITEEMPIKTAAQRKNIAAQAKVGDA